MSESNFPTDGDNPQPSSSTAEDPTTATDQSTTPLSWPDGDLSRDWIRNFTSVLSWSSRHVPPSQLPSVMTPVFLQRLILTASNILHKEPNCMRVDPTKADGEGASVVVVGDVHGQLHDVIFLLEDAGFPGEDRFFVFNGDYVDRGAWGLETFVLLLAWKIFLPHRVFLLRGNHESKYCTSYYGFEQEVMAKYGDQGQMVYRKCLRCFEGLPLASIIAGRVYTAHGGLFRGVVTAPHKKHKGKKKKSKIVGNTSDAMKLGSLDELERARRTVLDPPWQGTNLIPGDVLWSDPSNKPGLSPNKDRGIGLLWGPDMTEEFLYKYQIKLIIRSHEGPDARDKRSELGGMEKGYTIDHVVTSGQLITIFSAPDYPQFQATEERYNNQGAYIVLNPPDYSTPVFRSFEAVRPRPKVNAYYDFEEVIDSDEELDLKSMDNGSFHQANSSMSD